MIKRFTSYIVESLKLVAKKQVSHFVSFLTSCLIISMTREHSYQVLYIYIDVPRILTNDLWVFLFLKTDAECVKIASRAGTPVYDKAFIVNVNK